MIHARLQGDVRDITTSREAPTFHAPRNAPHKTSEPKGSTGRRRTRPSLGESRAPTARPAPTPPSMSPATEAGAKMYRQNHGRLRPYQESGVFRKRHVDAEELAYFSRRSRLRVDLIRR